MVMAKYLLDTNICVFIMRGKHNLDRLIMNAGIENCFISEITLFRIALRGGMQQRT